MNSRLQDGLAFVDATILYRGRYLALSQVLLDTGSASSVFSADGLAKIGVSLEPADPLRRIRGVGSSEFVFVKTLEQLAVGSLQAKAFAVEVGALDYGFALDGILGMDFLYKTSAVIDLMNPSAHGERQAMRPAVRCTQSSAAQSPRRQD